MPQILDYAFHFLLPKITLKYKFKNKHRLGNEHVYGLFPLKKFKIKIFRDLTGYQSGYLEVWNAHNITNMLILTVIQSTYTAAC